MHTAASAYCPRRVTLPTIARRSPRVLSKGQPEEQIWRDPTKLGADVHLRRRAVTLHTDERTVTDDRGDTYTYDKVLLATGGKPKRLSFGGDDIVYYRTFDDYQCCGRKPSAWTGSSSSGEASSARRSLRRRR